MLFIRSMHLINLHFWTYMYLAWALKCMRAFLLSLRMYIIREHAQMHMVKEMVDLYQVSSLIESTNTMISSLLKPHTNAYRLRKTHTEHF